MTIQTYTEKYTDISITETLDGVFFVRTTQRKFDVHTDGASSLTDVMNSTSTPAYGDSHPDDAWMTCQNTNITRTSATTFEVISDYKSIGDPTSRPPEISYGQEFSSEPIDSDVDGNPLCNSADEPLDPPLEEEFSDRIITYSFYGTIYAAAQADALANAINNAAWGPTGAQFAAKTVRLRQYTAEKETIAGSTYFKITIVLAIRADGWSRRYLDQGYRTKTALGEYTKILGEDGEPVADPVRLNGSGGKLTSGDPVYITRDTRPLMNFALLPINQELL